MAGTEGGEEALAQSHDQKPQADINILNIPSHSKKQFNSLLVAYLAVPGKRRRFQNY